MTEEEDKIVVISVWHGIVSDVKNLPIGWKYRVVDEDVLDEEEEMCADQMSAEQAIGGIYGLFGGRLNSQVM